MIFGIFFGFNALAGTATLKIDAASSLTNVLPLIATEFRVSEKDAPEIVFNFDATSKLAKQIQSGAPADLIFAADTEWMDFLEQKNKIINDSRIDLLSNKMVVIVPTDAKTIPSNLLDLSRAAYQHIALAGESVPAGKFARAALKSDGVYTDAFQKKIVNSDNVRIALSWVAKHEADAGIVFATDAKIEPKVKIAFYLREGSHPKIVYPGAVILQSKNAELAKKFLHFCKSQNAKKIFENAGFTP